MAIISDKIIEKLQYRIEQEEFSSRLYKAMSIHLNLEGYVNASKVWKSYSVEEVGHAQWVYDYMLQLNIKPNVPKIDQPQTEFKGLQNIVALSYKHEVEVTGQCKELAELCAVEGDYMTMNIAQKFLDEQVDEIEKLACLVDQLKTFGVSKEALRLFDIELGKGIKNG